jgi:hypothetical protein
MCMNLKMLLSFVLFATAALAKGLAVRQIHQFPQFSFLENMAIRKNGSILTTRLDQPWLQEIDPTSGQGPSSIYYFGDYMAVGGIVETVPDLFMMVAGNFSLMTLTSHPGTYSVFSIDYRPKGNSTKAPFAPLVTKLTDVPEAGFLDGMTYAPNSKKLFIADAMDGVIYRMDPFTGFYTIAVNSTLTRKCHKTDLEAVNGLKYHDGHIYWTNTGCDWYAKIKVNSTGQAVGDATLISDTALWIDDFAINANGTAFAAASFINQIVTIGPKGKVTPIAGNLNSTQIAQPTAVVMGRTPEDIAKGTIYVATAGGIGDPINGTVIVGAQLLAIDTK